MNQFTAKVAAPTTCMYARARAAIEPIVIDRELKKTATMGALTGIGVVQNVSEGTKKVHFVLIASPVTFRHSSVRRSSVFAYMHRDENAVNTSTENAHEHNITL